MGDRERLALPGFEIFRSQCEGIGYWTHFLLGALVGLCFVRGWTLAWVGGALGLITYQVLDYLYGSELILTEELALARDLGEYGLAFSFVVVGSWAERQRQRVSVRSKVK